jgi:catechol-2,3-dioxygenase
VKEGSKWVTEVTAVETARATKPTVLSPFFGGAMRIEKISAVTLRVLNMKASVRFYVDVLGMEIVHGGEDAFFS